jgi:hypothetical protein
MAFINENIGIFRAVFLALLVVAFIGPWSYDQISVPPEWPCDATYYVRLEGDLCGMPVLGITVLSQFVFGYLQVVPMLLTGEIDLGSLVPELIPISIILLIVLPVLTSLFLLLRSGSRVLRRLHAFALLFAAGLGVLAFTATGSGQQILWGGQLYFGMAALMLVLELSSFWVGNRPARFPAV